jgi:hypothetical protein
VTHGFGDSAKETRPFVVIDSIDEMTSAWTRRKHELETPTYFITGNYDEVYSKAYSLDEKLRLTMNHPVSGIILNMTTDLLRKNAETINDKYPLNNSEIV